MSDNNSQLQINVVTGVDLVQLENMLRAGLKDAADAGAIDKAAPESVSVEQGAQGIVPNEATAIIVVFGPVVAHMIRDVWDRYIRPRLDARFGTGSVKLSR